MILNEEPGGWGAETARPASASTAPSLGRITATPPSSPPSASFARLLQAEPDRRRDRASAAAGDALDHAVAEPQRGAGAPAEALVVDALEPGRLVTGRRPRSRRPWGRSPAAARRRRRCCRAAAGRRCDGAPPRPPGRPAGRSAGRPRDAAHVVLLAGRERERAAQRAEVLRRDRHRDAHAAAAQQRADAPDPDLLHARRLIGAPVVGQERDPRVRLAAGSVDELVHRGVVAARPRFDERLDRLVPVIAVQLGAGEHVAAVAQRGEDHDDHEQDAQRRPAAVPAAGRLRRRKEQRTGPGGVPEPSGTASTSAGHRF